MSSVQVSVSIAEPADFNDAATLLSNPPSAVFPLEAHNGRASADKPFEPHYTNLLAALEAAQASLNHTLTEWKEAIGDAEKIKEVVAKPGQGKAMLMVQGAREVDGRKNPATMFDGEQDSEEDEEDS